jgi:hypothetical protein
VGLGTAYISCMGIADRIAAGSNEQMFGAE